MQAAIGQQASPNARRFSTPEVYSNLMPAASGSFAADPMEKTDCFVDLSTRPISGSLQNLRTEKAPAILPDRDPYRNRGSLVVSFISFSSNEPNSPRGSDFADRLEAFLAASLASAPKVVASFGGRVESMSGSFANVLLINDRTGERTESRCDAEVLQENGISAGDDFRFEIVRTKGATATRFSKLHSKTLPKQKLDQIRASIKDRWTF